MRKRIDVPYLSIRSDGYQIETQHCGRGIVSWQLLVSDDLRGVKLAAYGWTKGWDAWDNARQEAYDAYLTHSNWSAAKSRTRR